MASPADPASDVTVGVASMEECGDSVVIPSACVCDYDDYFYDGQYDDCPDYYDYDESDYYGSFPSVYDFVELDDYELYHDLQGSNGCGVYCVYRGAVDVDVSYWSDENKGHDVQRGDVILPLTGSEESPAVLEHSVVGIFGSGGFRYGTREAAETPQEMVVDLECQDTVWGCCRGSRCAWSTLGRCRNCLVIQYVPYPTNLYVDKFASTSNLCTPGMMCTLNCPWIGPYLFVSLCGWLFGIQDQPDLTYPSILPRTGRESSGPTSGGSRLFPG